MHKQKDINHWCVVCGRGYHSCDTCSRDKSFTPWRSLTDTVEHYKIFMVLKDYQNKVIDKAYARELLSGFDLSDHEAYKDSVKHLLADVFDDTELL